MKRIHIKWTDSRRYMDECHKDDTFEVAIIETVGWLVRKEKLNNVVIVAQDIIGDNVRGVMVIPQENILETTYL